MCSISPPSVVAYAPQLCKQALVTQAVWIETILQLILSDIRILFLLLGMFLILIAVRIVKVKIKTRWISLVDPLSKRQQAYVGGMGLICIILMYTAYPSTVTYTMFHRLPAREDCTIRRNMMVLVGESDSKRARLLICDRGTWHQLALHADYSSPPQ
jgi:hypothetical protein